MQYFNLKITLERILQIIPTTFPELFSALRGIYFKTISEPDQYHFWRYAALLKIREFLGFGWEENPQGWKVELVRIWRYTGTDQQEPMDWQKNGF